MRAHGARRNERKKRQKERREEGIVDPNNIGTGTEGLGI